MSTHGAARQCEICQALVPPVPADETIEFEDGPPSLIEHRWTAHGISGVTRCSHCGVASRTESLADHLSLEHNLPPPPDALRRQYEAERRITVEISDLGDKIAEVGEQLAEKLDTLRPQPADFRGLLVVIIIGVIVAELLFPVVRAILVAALGAIGAGLR